MEATPRISNRLRNPVEKKPGFAASDWLLALGLFAAVLLAYQPAWNGKPIWDDDFHLLGPALQSWNGLERIWFQPGATPQYYPLVFSLFWLGQKLWAGAPLGFHLLNILLHTASALLMVKVLRRLEVPGAWIGAALWALHPVQVESVAWMSELKNCLSGLCYVGSGLAYLRYDREKKGVFYLVSLGLFGAGLLAKSVTATLPAALLLVFWWKRKQLRWKEDIAPLGPFFLAGLGMGMFTAWIERTMIIGIDRESHLTIMERCLIPGRALWFYLGKLAWPHPLVFIYPRWELNGAAGWQCLFAVAALLLAAGLWHWRRRLGFGPLVGLLYFAGTLFPALGFFDVYPFRYSFVADHFQYLACLGPLALAGAGTELGWNWPARRTPLLKPACSGVLLMVLGALTWVQCRQYADVETLWRATLAGNPGCWMAHDNYGTILLRQGKLDQAAGHFKTALQLHPDDANAHKNLGIVLSLTGDVAEAIAQFRKGLEILPNDAKGRDRLGNLLIQQGKVEEAVLEFRKALEIEPGFADGRNDLGIALLRRGKVAEAIAQFQKALEIEPDWAEVRNNLGIALMRQGKVAEAVAQYRAAVAIRPGHAKTVANLGHALLQQGEVVEAIAQFQKALEIQPDLSQGREGLGLALLRNGDFNGAMACFEKTAVLPSDPVERWYKLGNDLYEDGHLIEAIVCYRQTLAISPRLFNAWGGLGMAFLQNGQSKEAVESWQRSLDINPAQPLIMNNLAWLMATAPDASLRNGTTAVVLAGQANQLTGGTNPLVLSTLAAAYAESGRYDDASATARKALNYAHAQTNEPLAASLQEQIKLYDKRLPMRAME